MSLVRRFLSVLFLASALHGQPHQVAITIDDLPRGGDSREGRDLKSISELTRKLLAPLRNTPVIGFVNAGRRTELDEAGLQSILKIWVEHGAELGNHAYSHSDLNNIPLSAYTEDIIRGEPAIIKALGRRPIYFRHPYLHAGKDLATKRGVETFLAKRGYRVAPVTLDNADWVFAFVYASALQDDILMARRVKEAYIAYMESILAFFEARSKEVVGRDFPQVLLLHVNQLNADAIPALLNMMERRAYKFVSLDTALRDEAYRLPDEYAGTGGFSWIHRWSKTKGMPPKGEPDEPAWILQEFRRRSQR